MSKSSEMDQAIKRFIIDAINPVDHDVPAETTQEKIDFLRDTFQAEYGWAVARYGRQGAIREWLQGLPTAISLPYTYPDIIKLAKDTGGLAQDAAERQEDKIIDSYWSFMAAKICQLFDGYRVPKGE